MSKWLKSSATICFVLPVFWMGVALTAPSSLLAGTISTPWAVFFAETLFGLVGGYFLSASGVPAIVCASLLVTCLQGMLMTNPVLNQSPLAWASVGVFGATALITTIMEVRTMRRLEKELLSGRI